MDKRSKAMRSNLRSYQDKPLTYVQQQRLKNSSQLHNFNGGKHVPKTPKRLKNDDIVYLNGRPSLRAVYGLDG